MTRDAFNHDFYMQFNSPAALPLLSGQTKCMKKSVVFLFLILPLMSPAAPYAIAPGQLHRKGTAEITVLPDAQNFRVRMSYKLKSKDFVPVPKKYLQDEKVMEFPAEFRTVAGYQKLEKLKRMEIPKATLVFSKRGEAGGLKDAYFIEVHPTNRKSRITIVYHPSLKETGWHQITITMLSKFPLLDKYELVATRVP